MDHALVGSPAVDASGNIYIGSLDDYLYCLKPDGSLNWKVKLDADINSSPIIAPNDRVLVATQTRLHSYTFEGAPEWNYEITTESTPAVSSDGTVYLAGLSDLHAIDADGSHKWTYDLSETGFSSPAIADDGTIYCAGKLYAINADGSLKWLFERGDINDIPCLQRSYFIGQNDTVTQHIHVTLSTETEGAGISIWAWSDGNSSCQGGSRFTLNKLSDDDQQPGGGTGDDGAAFCFVSTARP